MSNEIYCIIFRNMWKENLLCHQIDFYRLFASILQITKLTKLNQLILLKILLRESYKIFLVDKFCFNPGMTRSFYLRFNFKKKLWKLDLEFFFAEIKYIISRRLKIWYLKIFSVESFEENWDFNLKKCVYILLFIF